MARLVAYFVKAFRERKKKGKLPKAVVEVSINLRSKNLIDYVNKMTMNFDASYEQNQ
jgi:hypothetical protein